MRRSAVATSRRSTRIVRRATVASDWRRRRRAASAAPTMARSLRPMSTIVISARRPPQPPVRRRCVSLQTLSTLPPMILQQPILQLQVPLPLLLLLLHLSRRLRLRLLRSLERLWRPQPSRRRLYLLPLRRRPLPLHQLHQDIRKAINLQRRRPRRSTMRRLERSHTMTTRLPQALRRPSRALRKSRSIVPSKNCCWSWATAFTR